ncbi:hypothetical protein PG984_013328 [Apiospora sp. TS-2023a]
MSGFEIAGLVLGALPLAIEGAKALKTLRERAGFWWEFKTSFNEFLDNLQSQSIFYSQILDYLLEPFRRHHGSLIHTLMDDPHSPLWKDREFNDMLKDRFGAKYYHWLEQKLQSLGFDVDSLRKLLPTQAIRVSSKPHITALIVIS